MCLFATIWRCILPLQHYVSTVADVVMKFSEQTDSSSKIMLLNCQVAAPCSRAPCEVYFLFVCLSVCLFCLVCFVTARPVRSMAMPVLHLLSGSKMFFCPAGVTHCPNKREIWHGGADHRCTPPHQISRLSGYGDWVLLRTGVMFQESGFYLYALYNKNKPKSDELMTECGSEYFRVSSFLWPDISICILFIYCWSTLRARCALAAVVRPWSVVRRPSRGHKTDL